MNILVLTSLFPNGLAPNWSTFNKQQVFHLSKLCDLMVVAPVAWAPLVKISKKHELFSKIPNKEHIEGIQVFHPRYFILPKIGRSLYGIMFFLSILIPLLGIYRTFKFDLIFATWAYPDSFAATLIAKLIKKPLLIKVHGTDINEFTQYYLRRKMIVYALKQSNKVIAVSKALKQKMIELGVPESHIEVIPNGIDTNKFRPIEKISIRKELNMPIDKRIVLFVGNLKPAKGIDYLLDAFSIITKKNPQFHLLIIGEGDYKQHLLSKLDELKIMDFVEFLGSKSHEEIPLWMNACDIFCLPSLNEGIPNVILEAFACGKPVVATDVGGIPEVVTDECGILVESKNPNKLADAILTAINKTWNNEQIRQQVENLSWESNAKRLYNEIAKIM